MASHGVPVGLTRTGPSSGALLAQGLTPAQAGLAGAYLHGLAGRLAASPDGAGQAPIGASDLVRALPAAFRSL